MPDPNETLQEDSSPSTDVNAESSPAEQTEADSAQSGEATPQQATETPFHQHPRWQELQQDLREAKERAERFERAYFERESKPLIAQEGEEDPLANEQPEVREWMKSKVIPLAERVAKKVVSEKEKVYQQEIQALKAQLGEVTVHNFLQRYPDVKRGSEEARQIAQKIQVGYTPDDAYAAVMYPRVKEKAQLDERTRIQTLNKKKAAANVETRSIPEGAIKKERSFEEIFNEEVKKTGFTFGG
jgi:hypothetical protein